LIETQIDEYVRHFHDKHLVKPTQCQRCKQAGGLRWHGSYARDLIAMAKTYSVPIRRLFCTLCRHTFALLPSFIAKFHRYAKDVIRTALAWLKSHTFEATVEHVINRLMIGHERNLAAVTLYLWRRKFQARFAAEALGVHPTGGGGRRP